MIKLEKYLLNQNASEAKFDKEKHEYTLKGKKIISATQLLQEHGLGTDFSGVPKHVMDKASEKGEKVHTMFEVCYGLHSKDETSLYRDFPQNLCDTYGKAIMQADMAQHYVCHLSEYTMACERWGIAGRADFIGETKDGEIVIADVKSGNPEYLDFWTAAWQLKLYKVLFEDQTGLKVNKLLVWYFPMGDPLKLAEKNLTEYVKESQINSLLRAHVYGELFDGDKYCLPHNVSKLANGLASKYLEYVNLEAKLKVLKDEMEEEKQLFADTMAHADIKKINRRGVKFNYVKPFVRETLDTDKVKKHLKDDIKDFMVQKEIPASLRMSVDKEFFNDTDITE